MTQFDPCGAARRLASAWLEASVLDGLPEGDRPVSIEDGYAVQAEVQKILDDPVAGYKLGMSSVAGMRESGIGRPARGFMAKSRVHRNTAHLSPPPSGKLLVELEVCFRLGDRIPVGAPAADKLACIEGAYVGLEIVSSRFRNRMVCGVPGFLADDVGFYAYVLGDEIARDDWAATFAAPAVITLDGRGYCENAQGEARTDPVEALSLFIDDATKADLPLEPGMLITTGNLVTPNERSPRGTFTGHLGSYGVTCKVEQDSQL